MKKAIRLLVFLFAFFLLINQNSYAKENFKKESVRLNEKTLKKIGGHIENYTFIEKVKHLEREYEVTIHTTIYINGSFREILEIHNSYFNLVNSENAFTEYTKAISFKTSPVLGGYFCSGTLNLLSNEKLDEDYLRKRNLKYAHDNFKGYKYRYISGISFKGGFSLY